MSDDPLCVEIRCQTRGEFDPWYTVWLVNPDIPEDLVDVIFEDEDYRRCLFFCNRYGYEITKRP